MVEFGFNGYVVSDKSASLAVWTTWLVVGHAEHNFVGEPMTIALKVSWPSILRQEDF